MNKQLVQDIIKAGNKAMDSVPVEYTVYTRDEVYYCYNGLYYDDNHVEFTDDYDDNINLSYKDIIGIKVSDVQNVIQCVTEGEKVKDNDAETVQLSHLLITSKTPISLPTRVLYNNNINNHINVVIITYPSHNSTTIVTYHSTTYDNNNSIYFTTITLVDITISATSNYSNVLILIY